MKLVLEATMLRWQLIQVMTYRLPQKSTSSRMRRRGIAEQSPLFAFGCFSRACHYTQIHDDHHFDFLTFLYIMLVLSLASLVLCFKTRSKLHEPAMQHVTSPMTSHGPTAKLPISAKPLLSISMASIYHLLEFGHILRAVVLPEAVCNGIVASNLT
jgi:hypothetical protein